MITVGLFFWLNFWRSGRWSFLSVRRKEQISGQDDETGGKRIINLARFFDVIEGII